MTSRRDRRDTILRRLTLAVAVPGMVASMWLAASADARAADPNDPGPYDQMVTCWDGPNRGWEVWWHIHQDASMWTVYSDGSRSDNITAAPLVWNIKADSTEYPLPETIVVRWWDSTSARHTDRFPVDRHTACTTYPRMHGGKP